MLHYSRYQKVISRTTPAVRSIIFTVPFHNGTVYLKYLPVLYIEKTHPASAQNNATVNSLWSFLNELSLSLFVLGIFTDNSDCSLSFNNLALFTNWFY